MRFVEAVLLLILLAMPVHAQLAADKEVIDIELHPGELDTRTITLLNTGDKAIYDVTISPIGGDAKDILLLSKHKIEKIEPNTKDDEEKKAKITVICAIPPELKPGVYSGFFYIYDGSLPNTPISVQIKVKVLTQESYGLSLFIDDMRQAYDFTRADDAAVFDISVRNQGTFRDVAALSISEIPEAWEATLEYGDEEIELPYEVPLNPGMSRSLKLMIKSSLPGNKGQLTLTATSLGNRSKNVSVIADAEFGMEVRGYSVEIDVPEKMATNRSYEGALAIVLDVIERVMVRIDSPQEVIAIPQTQIVDVWPDRPGTANFTMLASSTGEYPLTFQLMDSNGIPMPEEKVSLHVVEPEGTAILTGDDFTYKALASLAAPDNRTLPVVIAPSGRLSTRDRERLQAYSHVVILGDQSVISNATENALQGIDVKRLSGETLCETSWRFTAEIWQNGTKEAVLCASDAADLFKGYQMALQRGLPLIICDKTMSSSARSMAEALGKRKLKLSKVIIVGKIDDETRKTLAGLGISLEEVAN
jgi:putative cell wall-binding protein